MTLTTAWLVVALFLAVLILIIALCAYDGREHRPPAPKPIRDASLGKDHYVGERQDRLRKLQESGHRQEQARDAIKRGW